MTYTFKTLTLKSGKKQLLMEFSPESDILSSFMESEVNSFGSIILENIECACNSEEPIEFGGNSCIATFEKEYSRIESQFEDMFILLRTSELLRFVQAFLAEKKRINTFDNKVSLD